MEVVSRLPVLPPRHKLPYNLGDPAIFASIAQQLASAAASKADAENKESSKKLNDENAEAQKLANQITRNNINAWKSTNPDYVEYPDGTRFYTSDPNWNDKMDKFEEDHPSFAGKADFVKMFKPESESAYNALYANSKRDAEVSMWRLQKKVNELKLADKDTMEALSKMDRAQYNQLVRAAEELQARKLVDDATVENLRASTNKINKEIDETEAHIALLKIQKVLASLDLNEKKNLGLGNLVHEFETNGWSAATIGKLLLSIIASNISMSFTHKFD